jgi:hypothetical protein
MDEKQIYQEIPGGRNKFHSAILTSFSFNFHHFEYQVLKTLKHKWVTNVGVLVDSDMLDNTIGLSSGGLRQLTQSYSINGIKSKGAFHPKITFLIGDNELLMIMGSGNITAGGHGKNHETFTTFYADSLKSPFLPLLIESWRYIQHLAKEVDGYSKDRIFNIIPRNCELLKNPQLDPHIFHKVDDQTEIALVYNDTTSIMNQVLKLIPPENIDLITVVSPYFDEDGTLLLRLLEKYPKAKLQVYIPNDFGLPPNKMAVNKRISFFSWENTTRGKMEIKGADSYVRKLHSKIFNFQSKETEYCFIGSANATVAAFGTENTPGVNDEFGAIYKAKNLKFLKKLGITGTKINVEPSSYVRTNIISLQGKTKEKLGRQLRLISCDLNGLTLKLFLKNEINLEGISLLIYNDVGVEIFRENNIEQNQKVLSIRINNECLKLNPAYVAIESSNDESKSNKQVINYLDKLYHTDPSKANRTIQGLIGALEIGKINEFQIMTYMNDLSSKENSHPKNQASPNSSKIFDKVPEVHSEMTYSEAVEASKNQESNAKLAQTHNTIRIWQTIARLFLDKNESNNEALNDEEEEGSITVSNDRKAPIEDSEPTKISDNAAATKTLRNTEKLASDFVKALQNNNTDKVIKINEVSLCQFLVVSHIITAIHYYTSYELAFDNDKNKYKGYTPEEWKKILRSSYHSIMQDVIIAFARFILSHELEDYSKNEHNEIKMQVYIQTALKHIIIYNYLINGNVLENTHSQITDLACLTIFKKLGVNDENFSEYVESISKSNSEVYFNFRSVLQLNKKLKEMQSNKDKRMFYHKTFGVCLVKETTSSRIKFRSIVDPSQIFEINEKEYKNLVSAYSTQN